MESLKKNIPNCIGFILDGNRRWARERGLHTLKGHQKGYENLKDTVSWCKDAGVKHMVAYVFSTENWNRSKEEVTYLMDLMRIIFKKQLSEIRKDGMAVYVIGDISLFTEDIQKDIENLHDTNPSDAKYHLWLAASYGGRPEILAGINSLLKSGKKSVNEIEFKNALWTAEMPDPDIIIRTGGEKRLSNFVTWSSVYSELFFVDTYWPDFSKEEFENILEKYSERERRHGK